MNAAKIVGEASVFERGPHVPITHMGYFKPNLDAFAVQIRQRTEDRTRSGSMWMVQERESRRA